MVPDNPKKRGRKPTIPAAALQEIHKRLVGLLEAGVKMDTTIAQPIIKVSTVSKYCK